MSDKVPAELSSSSSFSASSSSSSYSPSSSSSPPGAVPDSTNELLPERSGSRSRPNALARSSPVPHRRISTGTPQENSVLGYQDYADANASTGAGASASAVNEQVQIRRAGLSDYSSVVCLADIDGGQDYLYALYDYFVTDGDSYPLVATLDGKVVGFYMVTSFDGGRSVMRRAARVHEDYRGRGIYRRLEQELENYIRDHCPNAQYVSICKNEKDHMFHSRYLAQDFHQVYKREGTQMLVKAANIKSLDSNDHISDHDMIQTRAISADELKLLIRSEEIKKKLFPDNRLLNFYLSYRPMEENVRHLICERGGAFVSLDTDFHNINDVRNRDFQEGNDILPGTHDKYDIKEFSHTPIHVSRPPKGSHSNSQPHQQLLSPETINNVAMVTFYYCYPTAGKPCYFFDAYAKPGLRSPGDHFRSHLRENVLTLRKFFPDQDAVLPLTFDPSIPRDEVMSGLSEVGIVDEKPDAEKWQILYERRQRY